MAKTVSLIALFIIFMNLLFSLVKFSKVRKDCDVEKALFWVKYLKGSSSALLLAGGIAMVLILYR